VARLADSQTQRGRRFGIVAVFAVAYVLSYFFRSANAVIADTLTRDLGLSAAQLGFMTSAFFIAFALAQLVGTLAQRDLDKGLAATEREVLEGAKMMLSSELAVVQDISLSEAQRQLDTALETQLGAKR